jgi:hypothetical protein
VSQLNTRIDDDGCFVVEAKCPNDRVFQAADPNAVIALMKLAMAMADALPEPSRAADDTDLLAVAYDAATETFTVHARASGDDAWSHLEGTNLSELLMVASDIVTGG